MSVAPAQTLLGVPGVGIVYFGNEWFAENRTSSHHIARHLSTSIPVLYVDSPGMRAPSTSGRDLKRIVTKVVQALRVPSKIGPNLWHCTVPQWPWRRMPGAGFLNRWFGAWAVRRGMRHVGITRPVLWYVVPHPSFMINAIDHILAIYYCIDDYAAHPGVDVDLIKACDAELTQRADHVFVAPPALVQSKQNVNPATTYSPHGVDVALFSKASEAGTVVAPIAAALGSPVIGYFGLIAAWTDLELIEWLARERPQWQFLLVGHPSVDVAKLRNLDNVTLVGPQPYETLPQWAKAFDVAIIPYKLNQQVRNANPLKLREYLATGKPVVSVRTAEVERFSEFVYMADDRNAYLEAIEQALSSDSPAQSARRMGAVRDMSWAHRAQSSLETAAIALEKRGRHV